MLEILNRGVDLLTVMIGFSLIIIVHELGHFLAARWAGIRVLAFAVGFGPAICSYRRGVGFQSGSSAAKFDGIPDSARNPDISTTEYRLNALPLGGYVKMLGQDDLDPTATSGSTDSYQNCAPWKRMIVISAGVIFNIIMAAALFVVVFLIGLDSEPPTIGRALPGSPAAAAVALETDDNGNPIVGLRPNDDVLTVNGTRPNSFADVGMRTSMSRSGTPVRYEIQRDDQTLTFDIVPERDDFSNLLSVGIIPPVSTSLRSEGDPDGLTAIFERFGLNGVTPGMRLTSVNGMPAQTAYDLDDAAIAAAGAPIAAVFEDPDSGETTTLSLSARPVLQRAEYTLNKTSVITADHLLGLTPAMGVEAVGDGTPADDAGLQSGDVFAVLGDLDWPSTVDGIRQIRARDAVRVEVMRQDDNDAWARVDLGEITVKDKRIGFNPKDDAASPTFIARPTRLSADKETDGPEDDAATTLGDTGGWQITAVGPDQVNTFADLRQALLARTDTGPDQVVAALSVSVPVGNTRPERQVEWTIARADIERLQSLGWESPLPVSAVFAPAQFKEKADSPVAALAMGINRTQQMMRMTYLTFLRLAQGSVKIEHLNGPVGIAHTGTIIADRGVVWLLFFIGLISVNLAVINFLPIPIVDGGHFLYLLYEQFTGKPPSIGFQNTAALAGLALIACVFLVVTFNDISRLIGG